MALEKMIVACRVCLEETKNIQSIFHPYDSVSKVSEKISTFTGVNIIENDGLPHCICVPCIEELKITINFVKKCKQSDEQLRKIAESEIKETKDLPNLKLEIKEELLEIDYQQNNSDSDGDFNTISIDDICEEVIEKYSVGNVKGDPNNTSNINPREKKKRLHKGINRSRHLEKKEKNLRKGPSECETCGLQVKSQSALAIHMRKHTGERPYECSSCHRKFSQKSSLRIHIDRLHLNLKLKQEKDYTCENCGKTFSSTSNLNIHKRIHTGEMPYECKFCNKRFMQMGSYISHKRRHTGEKPYSCKICGKTFVELTHLKRHRSVHSEDKPFICNICGKGVKSPFALKQHTKLHTNVKEHVCDQCGMSFMMKGNLDSHIRVVHSERSGQCTICRKLCSNLADHMVNHTGEKPYQCEVCSKTFAHNRGLIVHSRQHTAANKYKCNVDGCNQSFSAQWVQECHILKHTGHTPYVCKYCSKGFLRVCHLTKHMKLSHPNEWKKVMVVDDKSNIVDNYIHVEKNQ